MADNALFVEIVFDGSQLTEGVQKAVDRTRQGADDMAEAMESANSKVQASTEKAKATLSLLSDEIGVTIPGEIRSLIAEIPGVGATLEAAFSAVAAIAIIQVLVEIGEKIASLSEEAEKHREAWISIQSTLDQTTQRIGHALDQQKAKYIEITQGPIAAMEYELGHMRSIALQAFGDIAGAMEKVAEEFGKEGGIWTESGRANKEASQDFKKTLADMKQAMHDAAAAQPKDLLAPFEKALAVIEEKIKALKRDVQDLPTEETTSNRFTGRDTVKINQEKIAVLQREIGLYQDILDKLGLQKQLQEAISNSKKAELGQTKTHRAQELGTAELEAQKKVSDAELRLEEQTIQAMHERHVISDEDEIALLKATADKKFQVAQQELEQKLALLQRDPTRNAAQIKSVEAQIAALESEHKAALLQIDQEYYKEVEKNGQEAVNKAAARDKQLLANWRAMREERMQALAEKEKAEDQLQEQSVEQQLVLGNISRRQEIAQLAALKQDELQIEINYLKDREKLYQNDAKEIERIEAQIGKLEAQQAQIGAKAVTESLKQQKAEYDKAFSGITSAFSSFTHSLLSGNESLGQAWARMVDDMVSKFIAGLERQLIGFIEHKLMEVAIHAQAEVTKDAASKASHAKEDTRTAYSAAKAAYESVVHTPIIGPILAPIEAAVAFAAVSALGSAEDGQYIVPQKQLTMLHPQEMVLPAGLASRMRDVVEGRGGGTSGVTVVVNHSVNAIDAESFQGTIRKHGNMIGNEVARVLKRKGFARST